MYIDPTLARGLTRQLLENDPEELRRKFGAMKARLTTGCQRDGPYFRRFVAAMNKEFADRILLSSVQRLGAAWYFLVPTNGKDLTISVITMIRKKSQINDGQMPILIVRHALERMATRINATDIAAYRNELGSALHMPMILHMTTGQWPHLYAQNQSYCLPSASGAFFGELQDGLLKILTFVDNDKFTETQRAHHHNLTLKLERIYEEEGINGRRNEA